MKTKHLFAPPAFRQPFAAAVAAVLLVTAAKRLVAPMKKLIPLLALCALALPARAATVNYVWNNSDNDMLSPSSYTVVSSGAVSTVLPDSDDFVWFDGLPVKQPYLSGSLTLYGIRFASTNDVSKSKFYASTDDGLNGYNHCGWVMTGAEGAVLTLKRSANLGQSENNQGLLNHCSYGTNRIECAVAIGTTSAKIIANAGHLVLAGPISQAANGTTLLLDSGASTAALVLEAANPDFNGILDASNANVELAHPDALCGVKRVVLTSSNGGSYPRYFRNVTGEELVCDHPFQFWMNKCEATVFEGPPMRFTGATLCPDSGLNHTLEIKESLTVGAVSNKNASSTTAGRRAVLDYYGPGSLHVLGAFGPAGVPGVTNVLRLLGGTVVLHDPQTIAETPISIGQKGTNSRRPRLGIPADISVKAGLVPGGEIYYRENCGYGGWAAYGGDRVVTMEAEIDGVLRLFGWKGNNTGLAAGTWNGSSDWYLTPSWFLFGAEDADGTVTLANETIDVNLGDNNAHFELGAFQGGAFVAGRLAGNITNSVANYLGRQIHKDVGDGAVAIDGQVFITGGHYVSAGGLLFNGPTAGTVTAKNGGWLGGTGTVHAVTVESGGVLRPGEQGGTLTSDGAVTMAAGSTLIADIGPKTGETETHGCLKLTGRSVALKANGTVTVVPSLVGDVTGGRRIKIIDWGEASNPTATTLCDLENYTLDYDAEVFSKAQLSVDGTGLYLSFAILNKNPTILLIF